MFAGNAGFRIDSEYFQKKYLQFDSFLKNKKADAISKYAKISDGDHSIFPDNQSSEVRYLQAKDIKQHFIEDNNPAYVSKTYFEKNSRSHIIEENIILSIMGSVGDIAITPKGFSPSMANRAIAIIKEIIGINPYYLFSYLCTKFGQLQIERQKNGGVQERINLDVLSAIEIPHISADLQTRIEELVKNAHFTKRQSVLLYSFAEMELLDNLGLSDWQPVIKNNNQKSFKESFLETGRLDAEYYQPKYDELLLHLRSFKQKSLDKIVFIYKSIEPGSEAYQNEGIPFIRVANLFKTGLTDVDVFLNKVEFSDYYLKLRKNTILLSKDGSVGIAYKVEEDMDAVTSSAILHLKVFDSDVLPDYLCLILNSIIVKLQAERDAGGSIIQHWKPSEIGKVIIPIVDMKVQELISAKIQESFNLQKRSKVLLEAAKRAVEIAIEQNEDVAMQYLKYDLAV